MREDLLMQAQQRFQASNMEHLQHNLKNQMPSAKKYVDKVASLTNTLKMQSLLKSQLSSKKIWRLSSQ